MAKLINMVIVCGRTVVIVCGRTVVIVCGRTVVIVCGRTVVIVSDCKIVSETYRLQKYTKEFTKEKGNKHFKAKNFILTLLYT